MEVGGVVDGEDGGGGGVGEVEVWLRGGGGGGVGVVGCRSLHLHVGGERESEPVVDIGGGALVVDATLHLLLLVVFSHTKHTLVSRLLVVKEQLNHWRENGVIISCLSTLSLSSSLSQETQLIFSWECCVAENLILSRNTREKIHLLTRKSPLSILSLSLSNRYTYI